MVAVTVDSGVSVVCVVGGGGVVVSAAWLHALVASAIAITTMSLRCLTTTDLPVPSVPELLPMLRTLRLMPHQRPTFAGWLCNQNSEHHSNPNCVTKESCLEY